MSTGQEEMPPAKPDDDTEIKSSNEAAKIPSTDEVDHSKNQSLEKNVLKPLEDANKNTDSGFKDLGSESTEKKSSSDNTDDNSEFELKWDDDESDEQSVGPSEKVQAGENDKTKADVDGTTLSGTDIIDENKLLESSPSNNKDTAKTSPSNSTEEETAITDDVGEIVDENKLLEGPESDEVDEEKLLLESDDNRDDSPSKDVNTDSVKTDISKANEKLLTSTEPDVPPLDQASNAATENVTSDSDFQDAKSKELLSNEELKVDPSKIFACETITKLINEHTSPIDSPTPSSSSNNSSSIDATDDINTEHGLNKPDMMLEIPTQEIIELFDETDSISTQNDDEMEVDDASPKTATVDDKKPVAEEKSDLLILKPSDMCKDLDTENQKGCDEFIIKDVSEDDWCEIERRLEGFEDSFKASQLNQKSKEPEKDDAKEREGKTEETENLPLTDAQKMVIETENKALLKTLQDSILDSTAELTSASMNVDDDDESTSHLEDEPLTESPKPAQDIDTAVKELEDAVKEPENAVVSETVSQSAPNTTQEDIINSGKEINADSNLDNRKLDSKSDNIPSEVTQEIQSESKTTQPDIASPKTDQSSNKDTMELANETKIDDKLPTSNIEDTSESVIQQSSTEVALPVAEPTKTCSPADQNDDEVSSTQEPVKTISPSKSSDNVDTSIPIEEEKNTSIEPVDNQVVDKIEVDVNPSGSKLPMELEAKIQDATVPPSTAKPNEIEDTPSTAENTEKDSKLKDSEELVKPTTVDDNTSTIDDKTSTTDEKTSTTDDRTSTNNAKIATVEAEPTKVDVSPEGSEVTKAQPSVLPMDVELTNENQTKTIEQSPTLPEDSEGSKMPDENAQQSMEIDHSTEFKVPLTTTNASSTEESAEKTVQESAMEVDSITSVVEAPAIAKDNELPNSKPESTVDNIDSSSKELQPSTSENLELSAKELPSTSDVAATSKHDDETPSTSKTDDETPSTSKTDVEPSTSAENTKPVSDPDSDEVTETSDSLGLLAESSRVMEDDDDQDDDDDADNDADDDDDYDPEDESSNQMTAEHSEDSNAPFSETEAKQDPCIESPGEEKAEFSFAISDVFSKQEKEIEETDAVQDQIEDQIQDDIEVTADEVAVATIDVVEATIDDVEATIDDVEATIDDVEATIDDVQAADDTAIEQKEEDKDESNKQADIETVKLSDTSDNEAENESMLKKLLGNDEKEAAKEESVDKTEQKNEEPSGSDMNIVELEESSSEDDIQEVKNASKSEKSTLITVDGLNITIPGCVEVSNVKVAHTPDVKEEVVQGTDDKTSAEKPKPKFSLEIFSLDSDEEDSAPTPAVDQKPTEDKSIPKKCINMTCTSTCSSYYKADASCVAYYKAQKKKKALVCAQCADVVVKRNERLIQGIKDLTPLLNMDTIKAAADVVELSDSESEDEDTTEPDTLGETGASLVEASLAQLINATWDKFRMDSRLHDAEVEMTKEMEKLQEEGDKIKAMLNECQVATDKLRNDLYATFEYTRRERDAIIICDTPLSKYSCLEYAVHQSTGQVPMPENRVKRRMSSANEVPAKRPAIPLGYSSLDGETAQPQIQTQTQEKPPAPTIETTKQEDDKDIAVLKVSVEAAPSDLPPPGELVPPPLRAGLCVYAMRNSFGCWIRSKVLEVNGKSSVAGVNGKSSVAGMSQSFTMCRVKYDHKPKGSSRLFPARCLAYNEPANVRLTIGTRIIALFKDAQNPLKKDAFYSGIIAEVPNPVNNYRYLVFFDDGYAQYVRHRDTRVVCESSALVWEEVHPFSREFVKEYLIAYPERPMVRLHAGQSLKTEWNGKWWASRVVQVDASLVQVHFEEDNRSEWIYRGSTRLAPLFLALQRKRARPMPRTKAQPQINMPYVEYTRSEEQNKSEPAPPAPAPPSERENRQRAVAKKSTALPPAPHAPAPPPAADSVTSRVVYYTPKKVVTPLKMVTHNCGAHCKRKDVLALKDLRTYNPLAKPLLSGWERQIVRYKGHKEVMYKAPCGRRLRNMRELHRYLRLIESDMAVDLFDFTPHTHCLAEFVLNKCLVGKKDLSHGRENVPVPCVNYYDESLPEFCSYNTERTPTAGVPLNLDPEFLCGCDCTDDCEDKSKCACWQLTLEGARTIGLGGPRVGYEYKRLPEPLPSGIYECNSRCKCKHTCLNRVAQHPLQLKLQVFKTLNRGWGIRALNDVPKGSFLCVYAGNLLTDATANMDGLNEGDEYLAELDYIEVVEGMKEGYEEDIPEADKRLDKKNVAKDSEESEMSSSEEEDETPSKNEQEDGDFCPGIITSGVTKFSKRLRKREKNKKKKEEEAAKEREKDGKSESDFITISDDEEVREPSHFMAQAGMGRDFISKYKSVRSYFGKDEACYIMDAKVQGNIGRYLNHSCQPNVFVQNVFVDTHDPRFPWVAFFALSHIKAGTELTWNYNYDVGSVPGKVLYCYCGATNCRGRLL